MRRIFGIASFLFFILSLFLPSGAFAAVRSLSLRMSGADVVALQNKLIAEGYLPIGKNTGYFGPLTEAAVKKFQCDMAIICSGTRASGYGVYGPRTQAALLSTTGSFEFSGWIPYWRSATGTEDVLPHLSQLKSVMPFVYTIKANGTLSDAGDMSQEPWTSFIAAAKQAKVRVIPTVMWGNGDAIHKILSNRTTRIALEDEIAKLVKDNNFDGIDIDFEAKKPETINYFSTFLKGLDMRMGNKLIYCTVEARMPLDHRYLPGTAIPPDATDYANDYVQMNKYCDRIEIMAYDQGTIDVKLNAIRTAPYAPVADPEWVKGLVSMALKGGIARNKIILGIPTYGYEYTVTPLGATGYQYQRLWAFNPRYATDIASKLGIIPARNSAGEMGFSYDAKILEPAPTGTDSTETQQQITATTTVTENPSSQATTTQPFNYLAWSDAEAIADKVALAKQLGLRGVAVFKFDGGEYPQMWEVLK
ncbi:MAG: peptidoglycan-binding protein [Parcubacteria group bacterium]|nr:peptidoglycan-binding protein [Parcubacteria group bacterium]